MTTYPAITPSSREFSPGQYPHSIFQAMSGQQGRVRHSSVMVGSSVQLRYSLLDESEMIQILDHYNLVKSGFLPFAVPTIVWSGNDNPNDFTLPGSAWRYASPPEAEEVFCGGGTGNSGAGYAVSVVLESIPGEGVGLLGPQFNVSVVFAPGKAAASNGPQFVVNTALEFGRGLAPGFSESVSITFAPGTATGGIGAAVAGGTFEVQALFRPGFALEGTGRLFEVNVGFNSLPSIIPATYSQSSVYSGTTAASSAIMTDGSFTNTGAGTNQANPAWIKMDLGSVQSGFQLVIGTATSSMPGGWSKSYTENKNIQYSTDDTNWTTAFSTGSLLANGIYVFNTDFAARYIRIATPNFDYVAVSEFYARQPLPDLPMQSQITYSQSSVYPGTTPVSNAIMTDGSFTNTGAGTNSGLSQWIKMDLGAIYDVYEIIVGTATNSIPGGWDKSYTEGEPIQYSANDTNWTTAFNTPTFPANGIYTLRANFRARYIRFGSSGFVAISEFYARVFGPAVAAAGGASASGPALSATAVFAPGTATGA